MCSWIKFLAAFAFVAPMGVQTSQGATEHDREQSSSGLISSVPMRMICQGAKLRSGFP